MASSCKGSIVLGWPSKQQNTGEFVHGDWLHYKSSHIWNTEASVLNHRHKGTKQDTSCPQEVELSFLRPSSFTTWKTNGDASWLATRRKASTNVSPAKLSQNDLHGVRIKQQWEFWYWSRIRQDYVWRGRVGRLCRPLAPAGALKAEAGLNSEISDFNIIYSSPVQVSSFYYSTSGYSNSNNKS